MEKWLEIDTVAIQNNIKEIKKIIGPDVLLMVVVKANAYGHGIERVAHNAWMARADWLGVNSFEEAQILLAKKTKLPILILGYVDPQNYPAIVEEGLRLSIDRIERLTQIAQIAKMRGKKVKIHLKIDSGMSRWGAMPDAVAELAQEILDFPSIELEAVYTHFGRDERKNRFSQECILEQLNDFNSTLFRLQRANIKVPMIHAAASSSLLTCPKARFDMVRSGIMVYGLSPFGDITIDEARKKSVLPEINLKPALSFKTKIVRIKKIPKGSCVSYGCTHQVEKDSILAILPVGYSDGYDRRLSNKAEVIVRAKRAPVIGRISMNYTIIDVTGIPVTKLGDEVILIGSQEREEVRAEELAKHIGTISYEIVTRIPSSIKRIYK